MCSAWSSSSAQHLRPNLSFNADAPVSGLAAANVGGGAPVNLLR
jgi:hypothetical protein